MSDRWRELECFVAVVDAGSFVKAAQALHSSTASVSRTVSQLEERLGTRLLSRTTRRLALTEIGRGYHERAKELLGELEQADGFARSSSTTVAGKLRVSAPQSYGVLVLAPLWPRFLAKHPGVELEVTLSDRLVDLVEEGFDVAVRITRQSDSSLISRRIGEVKLAACASPKYLAKRGTPKRPADLERHDVIAYSLLTSRDTWHFETPRGPEEVKVHARFWVNNGDTCVEAARQHQGVVFQPEFLLAPYLARGELVRVLPDCTGTSFGVHAVYPSRRHLPTRVTALVDHLARELTPAGNGKKGRA